MPRIKSAKKRVDVAARNQKRNAPVKNAIRTAMKKVLTAKGAEAAESLKEAFSLLDKAVLKGVLKKNTVARYKSRLAKSVTKTKSA